MFVVVIAGKCIEILVIKGVQKMLIFC